MFVDVSVNLTSEQTSDAASALGNQIFVSLRKGDQYPPNVIETRYARSF